MPIKVDNVGFRSGNDIILGSGNVVYVGDPDTNGTWRLVRVDNDWVTQRRESGVWVDKGSYQP